MCQRFQYIQTKNLIEEVNIYMNGMDHSRKMAYGSILLKNGSDWHRLIWYGMWNGSERFYSIWDGDRWQTSPLAAQDPPSSSLSVYISSSAHHAAAQSNHYKFIEMPDDSSKSFYLSCKLLMIFLFFFPAECWPSGIFKRSSTNWWIIIGLPVHPSWILGYPCISTNIYIYMWCYLMLWV